MSEKWEIGKYKNKHSHRIYDCIYITPAGGAILVANETEYLLAQRSRTHYEPYKEPQKGTEKWEIGTYRAKVGAHIFHVEWVTSGGSAVGRYDDSKNDYILHFDKRALYEPYKEPQKGTVWLNIYPENSGIVNYTHETRLKADINASKYRIACIEVPWEEGQGL